MSAAFSPCCGWAEWVLSIFTARTRLSRPVRPPVNGCVSGAAGDGDAGAGLVLGAAGGGALFSLSPEQAAAAAQAIRLPAATSRGVWSRTINPFGNPFPDERS